MAQLEIIILCIPHVPCYFISGRPICHGQLSIQHHCRYEIIRGIYQQFGIESFLVSSFRCHVYAFLRGQEFVLFVYLNLFSLLVLVFFKRSRIR